MNTTKHNTEPWYLADHDGCPEGEGDGPFQCIRGQAKGYARGVSVAEMVHHEADRRRIVACVNACAGIDDPAEAIKLARTMLDAALGSVPRYCPGMDGLETSIYHSIKQALRALGG